MSMVSNGDSVKATLGNGGGNSSEKIVDLNAVELDPTDYPESVEVSPVDDIEKKIRRAERFGVSVTLTEEEKRNSRAERFGSVTTENESDDFKRKARADRFGVTAPADNKNEDEAKKKARLARFGNDDNVDSAEEDKRKARTLRFSEPAPEIGKVNGH